MKPVWCSVSSPIGIWGKTTQSAVLRNSDCKPEAHNSVENYFNFLSWIFMRLQPAGNFNDWNFVRYIPGSITRSTSMYWRSSSVIRRVNEVTLRWAWLVLGRVTVFGWVYYFVKKEKSHYLRNRLINFDQICPVMRLGPLDPISQWNFAISMLDATKAETPSFWFVTFVANVIV